MVHLLGGGAGSGDMWLYLMLPWL